MISPSLAVSVMVAGTGGVEGNGSDDDRGKGASTCGGVDRWGGDADSRWLINGGVEGEEGGDRGDATMFVGGGVEGGVGGDWSDATMFTSGGDIIWNCRISSFDVSGMFVAGIIFFDVLIVFFIPVLEGPWKNQQL